MILRPQPHVEARQQGDVVSKPAPPVAANPQTFPSTEVLGSGLEILAFSPQHRLSVCSALRPWRKLPSAD